MRSQCFRCLCHLRSSGGRRWELRLDHRDEQRWVDLVGLDRALRSHDAVDCFLPIGCDLLRGRGLGILKSTDGGST